MAQLTAAEDLRGFMRRRASSVVVVTAAGDAGRAGFTATSFTSVSLRPPVVSFCLARESSSWPALATSGYAGVHLLRADQAAVARTFATPGTDRFAAVSWHTGPHGVPLLDDTLGRLVGRITARIPAGDHTIVLCTPLSVEYTGGTPLLYHDGEYAFLSER